MRYGVASPPAGGYRIAWSRFDNPTGRTTALGAPTTTLGTRVGAGAVVLESASEFVQASVHAIDASHPAWEVPVTVTFRREGSGWRLVGLERLP